MESIRPDDMRLYPQSHCKISESKLVDECVHEHALGFPRQRQARPPIPFVSACGDRQFIFQRKIPRKILSILLISLLTLWGCLDFGAVRDFAALAKQASIGYAGIVDDMYQSCLRSAEFDPPANGDTPEKHCTEWKDVRPGLLRAESVLQDYLSTIGKLAGDETISYDKNLDSLKQELDGVKFSGQSVFNSKQVDALTGLGGFLLKAATDSYRRRQLGRTFAEQNDNLKTVTAALKSIVGHDYKQRLENEANAIEGLRVRVQRAADEKKEPLAVEIGMRQVQDRLRNIDRKKQAADSYVKTLDLIARGHQELFDHRKDLGSKDLAKLLWDDASQLMPLVQNMQKAF